MSLRNLPEHRENALLALNMLVYAEKMRWLQSAEDFFSARRLRNLLVHEYMSDEVLFLQSLQVANQATNMLFGIVDAITAEAKVLGLE